MRDKKISSYQKLKNRIQELELDVQGLCEGNERGQTVKFMYDFGKSFEKMMWSGNVDLESEIRTGIRKSFLINGLNTEEDKK
jgi:hypothetical protein